MFCRPNQKGQGLKAEAHKDSSAMLEQKFCRDYHESTAGAKLSIEAMTSNVCIATRQDM